MILEDKLVIFGAFAVVAFALFNIYRDGGSR